MFILALKNAFFSHWVSKRGLQLRLKTKTLHSPPPLQQEGRQSERGLLSFLPTILAIQYENPHTGERINVANLPDGFNLVLHHDLSTGQTGEGNIQGAAASTSATESPHQQLGNIINQYGGNLSDNTIMQIFPILDSQGSITDKVESVIILLHSEEDQCNTQLIRVLSSWSIELTLASLAAEQTMSNSGSTKNKIPDRITVQIIKKLTEMQKMQETLTLQERLDNLMSNQAQFNINSIQHFRTSELDTEIDNHQYFPILK